MFYGSGTGELLVAVNQGGGFADESDPFGRMSAVRADDYKNWVETDLIRSYSSTGNVNADPAFWAYPDGRAPDEEAISNYDPLYHPFRYSRADDVSLNVINLNDPSARGFIRHDKFPLAYSRSPSEVFEQHEEDRDNVDMLGMLNNEHLQYRFGLDGPIILESSWDTSSVLDPGGKGLGYFHFHQFRPIPGYSSDFDPYEHRINLGENQNTVVEHDGNPIRLNIFRDVPVAQRMTSAGIYNGSEGTFELSGVAIVTTKFDNSGTLLIKSRQLYQRPFITDTIFDGGDFLSTELIESDFLPLDPTGLKPGLAIQELLHHPIDGVIYDNDGTFDDEGLILRPEGGGVVRIYDLNDDGIRSDYEDQITTNFYMAAAITPSVLKVGNIDDYSLDDAHFSAQGHTGLFVNRGHLVIDELSTLWVDGDFVLGTGGTISGGGSRRGFSEAMGDTSGAIARIMLPPDETKGRFTSSGGVFKPGGSVGDLWIDAHMAFSSGGLEIEVDDFSADANAPGWDTLRVRSLNFVEDSNLQVQLVSVSPTQGTPGLAAGFNRSAYYSLPIVRSDERITDFDKAIVTVDTSRFANEFQADGFSVSKFGKDLHLVYSPVPQPGTLDLFSEGMQTPQTISKIPDGFGDYEGHYLVPDTGSALGGTYHIWVMSADGGAFTEFANLGPTQPGSIGPRGGLFLPVSFGEIGGRYLTSFIERNVANLNATPQLDVLVRIVTIDSAGNVEDFARFDYQGPIGGPAPFLPSASTTPVLAPQSFGNLADQVIFTDQFQGLFAVDQNGNVTDFVSSAKLSDTAGGGVQPFGAVFAPIGFGEVSDTLLISDTRSFGAEPLFIMSVDELGEVNTFATLSPSLLGLATGAGLRQMSFVPDGFGDLSGLLLVSVSGSFQGGGALGQLLALDENGDIVKKLRVGSELNKFDPRGVFFTNDGRILISDASDPIVVATIDDFVNFVPEPSSAFLAALGMFGFVASVRARVK